MNETDNVPEEIIPNFQELKVRLDVKCFEIFTIEWMTNQTEESYELFKNNKEIDSKIRKTCKGKYNKQKMAISTLMLFMKDIPAKPSVVYELGQWKGQITLCIKKGIEKCKKFIKAHKLRKETKRNELTVTLLNDPKVVEIFNANIVEITTIATENQCEMAIGQDTIDNRFESAFGQDTFGGIANVTEGV